MSDTGPDPAAMLQAIGAFLLATHPHEARPDAETPWLLRRAPSCPGCDTLRAALGPEAAAHTEAM